MPASDRCQGGPGAFIRSFTVSVSTAVCNIPVVIAMQFIVVVKKLFIELREFFSTNSVISSTLIIIFLLGRLSLIYKLMLLLHTVIPDTTLQLL